MTADDRTRRIERLLRERLGAVEVEIVDESAQHAGHAGARSGGGHYAVTVVSERFCGRSTLERHRLVYEALDEMLRRDIHALSVRAYAPGEL